MTLLVFGMDGAVREYIEEAIDRGLMPNMERFMEDGAFGEMESTIPPVTIPAWVSMFSGYRPDRFDTSHHTWLNEDYDIVLRNSSKWKGDFVWDRLDGEFGVINVPGTSPVWPINGFMVEGFPMVEDPDVYPSGLLEDIPDFDFVQTGQQPTKEKRRQAYHHNFEIRKKAFPQIGGKTDVRVEVFQLTDTNAHRSRSFEQVLEAYEKVDEVLGDRMEEYDNILLVSDHGFTHIDNYFYVNTWLKEKGYLEEEDTVGRGLKEKIQELAAPLAETFLRPFLKYLNDRLSASTGIDFSPKSGFIEAIDFQNTEAFSYLKATSNFGDININDDRWSQGSVQDTRKIREEIKEKLEGEDFVTDVWRSEDIYDSPDGMPDLLFRTTEDVAVGPPLFPEYLFSTDAFVHKRTGIYGAHGPAFRSGELEDADIVDVAPTLARYLGQELEADGSPLDIFAEDFEPENVSDVSGIDF
ncbi:MAG: alkaline phosphatase family protein [Candidatus Nanohaloarchaea archaeon]